MAKVITFTKPPSAITDLSGSLSAGGSLTANTTYYYVVLAVGNGVSTTSDSTGTKSGISNEFSITTDTTNKTVDLTWTESAGASMYIVFRRTTSNEYHLPSSWLKYNFPTTGSYSDDGTETFHAISLISVVNPTKVLPMGIEPRTYGVGHCVYSGGTENDPITPQDFYDAAVADGWTDYCKWDNATLLIMGNFRPDTSVAAQLLFQNITFIPIGYFRSYGYTGSRIRYGTLSTSGQAIGGVKFISSLAGRTREFWIGNNTELYNCTIDGCTVPNPLYSSYVCGASPYINFNGGKGKDITFRNYGSWFCRKDIPVSGLKLVGSFATVHNDCRLWSNIECTTSNLPYGVNSRLDTFNCLSSSIQIAISHANLTDNFIDCTFPNTTEDNGNPAIGWGVTGYDSTIQLWNSYLLEVLDEGGNPIENASIIIKDKNGNAITDFAGKTSYTTDASGSLFSEKITITGATSTTIIDSSKSWTTDEWLGYNVYIATGDGKNQKAKILSNTATELTITEPFLVTPDVDDLVGIIMEVKTTNITHDPDGSTYDSLYESYGPFDIYISKTGYQTYHSKKDITAKVEETVTLKTSILMLDDNGDIFKRMDEADIEDYRNLIIKL